PSAWGIYTDSEDPLTGEKVSSSINIWTHVNDLWSQNVVDIARYIKGELKLADITEGTFVHNWVQANEVAGTGTVVPTMTRRQVNDRYADFIGMDRQAFDDIERGKAATGRVDPYAKAAGDKVLSIAHEARAELSAPSANKATYEARREAARGTQFEAELMTK